MSEGRAIVTTYGVSLVPCSGGCGLALFTVTGKAKCPTCKAQLEAMLRMADTIQIPHPGHR